MTITDHVWGKKVIEKALQYANHEWYATELNVKHGLDDEGRFIDTPDVTWRGKELDCGWWKVNQINKGIPYGWGNASTINEFDTGILEGKYAGNVPEDKSRVGSNKCVGVDCSGLLYICWDLPKKITTKDIPNIAVKIFNLEEIRQGDIFAKVGSHVMLFIEFVDENKSKVKIIDSTRGIGRVSLRELLVADLLENGYEAYRKQ
jgi:hypothetical protein